MTVEAKSIIERGSRKPMMVPCLEGRCPEQWQLVGPDYEQYRCMRREGYTSRAGVLYDGNCYFHDNPYEAKELTYWDKDADKPKHPHGVRDEPTKQEWETAI